MYAYVDFFPIILSKITLSKRDFVPVITLSKHYI